MFLSEFALQFPLMEIFFFQEFAEQSAFFHREKFLNMLDLMGFGICEGYDLLGDKSLCSKFLMSPILL